MATISHDPTDYIKGLQSLLINDKKKIAFLFGAGSSLAIKDSLSKTVPAIGMMTDDIVNSITEPIQKKAIIEIKDEITIDRFNIETLISNLEQKLQVIGKGKLNGLNKAALEELIKDIKEKIRLKVSVHSGALPDNQVQTDFAEWIVRAERKFPIEIFTTNYDYLFELGLEHKNVPYYDGFTGSYNPFFNSESVNDFDYLPKQTKLWKLHGSLGWKYDDVSKKITRTTPDKNDILIYPSILKYNNSKKQPYEALMDRLSNYLKQDDAVLITCGYSFGDEHINERIITALQTATTSTVIALFFDNNFNENHILAKLAKDNSKISVYSNRSAVIGCKHGIWKLREEPNKDDTILFNEFFDEDAPLMTTDKNVEKFGDEKWTGEGRLIINNFSYLISFLKSMIVVNNC